MAGPRRSDQDDTRTISSESTLAQPPLYTGTSHRDKRAFMDAYLIYERKVRTLNMNTGTKIYLMSVSG